MMELVKDIWNIIISDYYCFELLGVNKYLTDKVLLVIDEESYSGMDYAIRSNNLLLVKYTYYHYNDYIIGSGIVEYMSSEILSYLYYKDEIQIYIPDDTYNNYSGMKKSYDVIRRATVLGLNELLNISAKELKDEFDEVYNTVASNSVDECIIRFIYDNKDLILINNIYSKSVKEFEALCSIKYNFLQSMYLIGRIGDDYELLRRALRWRTYTANITDRLPVLLYRTYSVTARDIILEERSELSIDQINIR